MRKFTLRQIADVLAGDVAGNSELEVSGVKPLEEAGPQDLSFFSNPRYRKELESTSAGGIIVARDENAAGKNLIKVDDPYLGFAIAMEMFYQKEYRATGISPAAFVHKGAAIGFEPSVEACAVVSEGASLGDRTTLMPGSYVGPGVIVGNDCVIHPNVTLEAGVILGDRVIIHAGTVVGSDGFGFAREGRRYRKIIHAGTVHIEDDVEIGACCTIDRAVMGQTVIGQGTKLDNLIQVGHNVNIGRDCILVSFVGLAGSVTLEDGVTMAGRSGVVGHTRVGEGATILAKSVVLKDVPPGASVAGYPATDAGEWRKTTALTNDLGSMRKKLRKLEKLIANLEDEDKGESR